MEPVLTDGLDLWSRLVSKDRNQRRRAIQEAHDLKDPSALPNLVNLMNIRQPDSWNGSEKDALDRKKAIETILHIGIDDGFFDELSRYLVEGEFEMRYAVAQLMGELGEERCVRPLKRAIRQKIDPMDMFFKSMAKSGDAGIQALLSMTRYKDRSIRRLARNTLIENSVEAAAPIVVDYLLDMELKDGLHIRTMLANNRSSAWFESQRGKIIEAYEGDPEAFVETAASEVMGLIVGREAIPVLKSHMMHEDDMVQERTISIILDVDITTDKGKPVGMDGHAIACIKELMMEAASDDLVHVARALRGLTLFANGMRAVRETSDEVNPLIEKFLNDIIARPSTEERKVISISTTALMDMKRIPGVLNHD